MHNDYDSRPTLRERITADLSGIAEIIDTSADGLVLERLPSGGFAWLRAAQLDPERVIIEDTVPPTCRECSRPSTDNCYCGCQGEEERFWPTEAGRQLLVEHAQEALDRAAGVAWLFGGAR